MRLVTLSVRGARSVLTRLAGRGYEVRVPTGTDKNGRHVFAHQGHTTVYRLPRFPDKEEPQCPLQGGTRVPPSVVQWGTTVPIRGEPQFPPSPHIPSGNPHPREARGTDEIDLVIHTLAEHTGTTVRRDHAALVCDQLIGDRTDIRDQAAFLTGAMRKDTDPQRFLPTPEPPRFDRSQL